MKFAESSEDGWIILFTFTYAYLHKILVCKHSMVVSISILRKPIPVLDAPIESKSASGRKKPYESLEKAG